MQMKNQFSITVPAYSEKRQIAMLHLALAMDLAEINVLYFVWLIGMKNITTMHMTIKSVSARTHKNTMQGAQLSLLG
jgi:hypothetical protein